MSQANRINAIGNTDVLRLSVVSSPSAVPLPPAVWLCGSALFGVCGITRRHRTTGSDTGHP